MSASYTQNSAQSRALQGDTATRDYSTKLRHFNAFAAVELQAATASLDVQPGTRVLEVGCGTGEAVAGLKN